MHRQIAFVIAVLIACLTTVAASAARTGSLAIHLTPLASPQQPVACPADSKADATCSRLSGLGSGRGLGAYSATATLVVSNRVSGGFDITVSGTITSALGTLAFTGDNSANARGGFVFTISLTGSGGLSSATGQGTLNFVGALTGTGSFIVDATIDAPGLIFDLTPPTLTLRKTAARALGAGRYAVTVHYAATDAGDPLTARLLRPGTAKPLASGPATGTAKGVVHAKARVARLTLRLTVTDTYANSTTRTIIIPVH